ncbi:hypothetical protein B0H13DRAFT_2012478 [Mycena leptocephala]|nr:hypothetical protein B0H13DRAFT_2012478 [Mycena leptocephala]
MWVVGPLAAFHDSAGFGALTSRRDDERGWEFLCAFESSPTPSPSGVTRRFQHAPAVIFPGAAPARIVPPASSPTAPPRPRCPRAGAQRMTCWPICSTKRSDPQLRSLYTRPKCCTMSIRTTAPPSCHAPDTRPTPSAAWPPQHCHCRVEPTLHPSPIAGAALVTSPPHPAPGLIHSSPTKPSPSSSRTSIGCCAPRTRGGSSSSAGRVRIPLVRVRRRRRARRS